MADTCGGHCCRSFTLSTDWETLVADAEQTEGFSFWHQSAYIVALFRSVGLHSVNPTSSERYSEPVELFTCAALGSDGLCAIYDHRPWLCRYYPGSGSCRQSQCKLDLYRATPLECQA